ncbi:hypothetical protein HK105_209097 [Polyrhizophydium stewartii]|uniref:Protein kinase domain-containing protein n=1 Tax=Polyrhizophydium stewartii TaxID=2732419 RepID=A0ABR4MW38_9FUNG
MRGPQNPLGDAGGAASSDDALPEPRPPTPPGSRAQSRRNSGPFEKIKTMFKTSRSHSQGSLTTADKERRSDPEQPPRERTLQRRFSQLMVAANRMVSSLSRRNSLNSRQQSTVNLGDLGGPSAVGDDEFGDLVPANGQEGCELQFVSQIKRQSPRRVGEPGVRKPLATAGSPSQQLFGGAAGFDDAAYLQVPARDLDAEFLAAAAAARGLGSSDATLEFVLDKNAINILTHNNHAAAASSSSGSNNNNIPVVVAPHASAAGENDGTNSSIASSGEWEQGVDLSAPEGPCAGQSTPLAGFESANRFASKCDDGAQLQMPGAQVHGPVAPPAAAGGPGALGRTQENVDPSARAGQIREPPRRSGALQVPAAVPPQTTSSAGQKPQLRPREQPPQPHPPPAGAGGHATSPSCIPRKKVDRSLTPRVAQLASLNASQPSLEAARDSYFNGLSSDLAIGPPRSSTIYDKLARTLPAGFRPSSRPCSPPPPVPQQQQPSSLAQAVQPGARLALSPRSSSTMPKTIVTDLFGPRSLKTPSEGVLMSIKDSKARAGQPMLGAALQPQPWQRPLNLLGQPRIPGKPLPKTPDQVQQHQQQHQMQLQQQQQQAGAGAAKKIPALQPRTHEDLDKLKRQQDLSKLMQGDTSLCPTFCCRYRIGEMLGDGAFGFVVTARRIEDNKEVAVKFIVRNKISMELWVEKDLPNEVYMLRTLQHPNIIQYIEHIIERDYVLLITELHGTSWDASNPKILGHKGIKFRPRVKSAGAASGPGAGSSLASDDVKEIPHAVSSVPGAPFVRKRTSCDLFECIDAHQRIPEEIARKIFIQIAFVVEYLNSNNYVHRDLKDENIVIDENYHIKLIDFGSASRIPKSEDRYFVKFNGTAHFASPEIAVGNKYRGPEAEIWALGVLLYTIVFGENPFQNRQEIIKGEYKLPTDINPNLRDLIQGMLCMDITKRLTIQDVVNSKWVSLDPMPPKKCQRKRGQIPPLRDTESAPPSAVVSGGMQLEHGAVAPSAVM